MSFNEAWEQSEKKKGTSMDGEKKKNTTDFPTTTTTDVDRMNGGASKDSSATASVDKDNSTNSSVENSTKLSRKSSFSTVSIASSASTKQ